MSDKHAETQINQLSAQLSIITAQVIVHFMTNMKMKKKIRNLILKQEFNPPFSSLSPEVHTSRKNCSPPQTAKGKRLKAKNSPTASGTLENWRKNGQ